MNMKRIIPFVCAVGASVTLNAAVEYIYAIDSRQGDRAYHEDRTFPNPKKQNPVLKTGATFFCVFDGHGGEQAAEHASQKTAEYIEHIAAQNPRLPTSEILKRAFAQTEQDFVQATPAIADGSGTTATGVYIEPSGLAYLINIGDSRTIVIRKVSKEKNPEGDLYRVVAQTKDHKPNDPAEKARIEREGGEIHWHGVWRVNGFALSRTLGDAEVKGDNKQVIADADITKIQLEPGDFVVLASDGVWDVCSSEYVALLPKEKRVFSERKTRRTEKAHELSGTNKYCGKEPACMVYAKNITEYAYRAWIKPEPRTSDNITAIAVHIDGITSTPRISEKPVAEPVGQSAANGQAPQVGTQQRAGITHSLAQKIMLGSLVVSALGAFSVWMYKKWQSRRTS